MEAFARAGTAWRFENNSDSPMRTLVELAVDAIELSSKTARDFWSGCITMLAAVDPVPLFDQIEPMSVPARRFACRLLEINARRLRDELDSRA